MNVIKGMYIRADNFYVRPLKDLFGNHSYLVNNVQNLNYKSGVFTNVINSIFLVRKVFTHDYFCENVITQKLDYNFSQVEL